MSRSPSTHGALSTIFQVCRVLQLALLIAALALAASVVSALFDKSQHASGALIGALSTTSIVLLYALLSTALYFDRQLPHLLCSALDTLSLAGLLAASTILLSQPRCARPATATPAFDPSATFTDGVKYAIPQSGTVAHRTDSSVLSKGWVCDGVVAAGAVGIVVAIVFVVSAACLGVMWWRERNERTGVVVVGDEEEGEKGRGMEGFV